MSDAEKAIAFDSLTQALTNQWYDGKWSWFCLTPSGGPTRETREDAIADLVELAKAIAAKKGSP